MKQDTKCCDRYTGELDMTNSCIYCKTFHKRCDHEWEEDEMFADGVITMMSGTITDMGKETRVVCKKCSKVDYVPKNMLERTNLLDNL